MMDRCDTVARYNGKRPPTCDDGRGCLACWKKHHDWIDATRRPMSRDFKEFYDYVCMQKRLIQGGRFKPEELPVKGGLHAVMSALEKIIRTGEYRHIGVMFKQTLDDLAKNQRARRGRPPLQPRRLSKTE